MKGFSTVVEWIATGIYIAGFVVFFGWLIGAAYLVRRAWLRNRK